jgi:sortase A
LDQLQPGDEVLVYTATEQFRYVVREWRIVEPTEVSVMNPTATPTITLISCYPYQVDTQRIAVFADLVTGASSQ